MSKHRWNNRPHAQAVAFPGLEASRHYEATKDTARPHAPIAKARPDAALIEAWLRARP